MSVDNLEIPEDVVVLESFGEGETDRFHALFIGEKAEELLRVHGAREYPRGCGSTPQQALDSLTRQLAHIEGMRRISASYLDYRPELTD
jgi:hypothetical protein